MSPAEPGAATWDTVGSRTLGRHEARSVGALAGAAAAADGVPALSEATLLALSGGQPTGTDVPLPTRWWHLLARSGDDLLGYAAMTHGQTGPDGGGTSSAELVVAPDWRRRGVGTALLRALWAADPAVRVWAHGDLPAARSLAGRHGLQVVRELWQMAATLDPDAPRDVRLPTGYRPRAFETSDAGAWLTVNRRAFADHPEQGRLGPAELAVLMSQPWFDPAGFVLLMDESAAPAGHPRLAAFHWTKVVEGIGEVYVLGIDPDYQGRGLAEPLAALGLEHLRSVGVRQVLLYVEATSEAAIRIYRRLGFSRSGVDVMYAQPRRAAAGPAAPGGDPPTASR